MDETKFKKPVGTRGRRPNALIKGKEYLVKCFARERSLFKGKNNDDIYKLLAIYDDIGMTFHTYMPVQYDNKSDEAMKVLNDKVKEGIVRIIYYGQISSSNELKILYTGEVVDQEKLVGIELIEESEKNYKRQGPASNETPTKRCKCQDEPL